LLERNDGPDDKGHASEEVTDLQSKKKGKRKETGTPARNEILLVQDPETGLELEQLLSKSLPYHIVGAASLSQGLAHLASPSEECALVVLDLALTNERQLSSVIAAAESNSLPLVLLARAGELERALKALDQGVCDIVPWTEDVFEKLPRILQWNLEMAALRESNGATLSRPVRTSQASSDESEAGTELVAGIVHQINNPLTTIMGSVELLKESNTSATTQRDYLERIHDASLRCKKALNDLSNLMTLAPPRLEMSTWDELLNETVALVEPGIVEVQLEVLSDLPAFRLDRLRFRTALLQLIKNAQDAAAPNDSDACVRIQVAPITSGDGSRKLVIRILDNGAGIAPEIVGSVMKPFFTTQTETRVGLGLNLARAAIEAHGGSLTLAAYPSGWTEARNELPWSLVSEAESESAHIRKNSVLVVDDESPIRELVGTMLAGSGYEVRDVATVDEALSQMRTNPAELVITDLRMPGLGGQDLFKRVENHDSKFVFMTGDTMSPESSAFLAQGYGVTLPKPFTKPELLAAVESAIGPA